MSELLDKVKSRRADLGMVTPATPDHSDLIPDPGTDTPFQRTQEDFDIDAILAGVDILQAYQLWCGKMQPEPGGKRESVMCSCPKPEHADVHPSAWMNLDKDVWSCGGCNEGGDKYDIAAYHFGHSVPSYKRDGSFPELRRQMAQSLGYTVERTVGGSTILSRQEVVLELANKTVAEPEPPNNWKGFPVETMGVPSRLTLVPTQQLTAPTVAIKWREIVPTNTFLHQWMSVCSEDDLPEEFYFWLGLLAVGFAAGDDVMLRDNPLVKGNLFVTLFGPTGMGKSRALRALNELLGKALPYEHNDPNSTGTYRVPAPGSGEALLDAFAKPIYDTTDPKKIIGYSQVRGLVRLDELADLLSRTGRAGSIMKPMLMGLYDAYDDMTHRSRGTGYTFAKRPYCSVVTTTQPKAIRSLLVQADADSGFVNRWVFAMGSPKKLVAIDRDPLDIDSCVRAVQAMRTWSSSQVIVALDEPAKKIWSAFFARALEPVKVRGDDSLLTRCDLTLKKIMLLFAINEGATVVTADIVERVLKLWPYLRDTYGSLGSEIGAGEFEDCRLRVLDFIHVWESEHKDGPSTRDLSRGMPKAYDRALLFKVISNLEIMGEINPETIKSTKGRPGGIRYRVAS